MLSRAATLLHYFSIMCESGIQISNALSPLSREPQKKIADELKRIYKLCFMDKSQDRDAQLWRDAIEFASCFGVNFIALTALFTVASNETQQYLSRLLNQARSQGYKHFVDAGLIGFDPENKLFGKVRSLAFEIAHYYTALNDGLSKAEFTQLFEQFPLLPLKYFSGASGYAGFANLDLSYNPKIKASAEQWFLVEVTDHTATICKEMIFQILTRLEIDSLNYLSILQNKGAVPDPIDHVDIDRPHKLASKKLLRDRKTASDAQEVPQEEETNDDGDETPPILEQKESKPAAAVKRSTKKKDGFVEVVKKKRNKQQTHTFLDYFCGQRAYEITVFKADAFFAHDEPAKGLWHTCPQFSYGQRLSLLFTLYYQAGLESGVKEQVEHGFLMELPELVNRQLDPSYVQKLDLHHLFTDKVDTCLSSCGLFETKDDEQSKGIQISIPGEIRTRDGMPNVGFFQYTFKQSPSELICIHRCFRKYNSSLDHTHISRISGRRC